MKKKTLITILSISTLLILGPSVYFGLLRPGKVSGGWFNDSWLYRKAITFNNSGSAVSNQKVKVDANTAALIEPNTVNFNTADLTFTAGMAKRNAGTGTSSPFAAGVMAQGNYNGGYEDAYGGDFLRVDSSQISGYFRTTFDYNQGTIIFWITPEWDGDDGYFRGIFLGKTNYYYWLYKERNGFLTLKDGSGNVSVITDISDWNAGNTYLVVIRWDTLNTLDGTYHASISIGDTHTFGDTAWTVGAGSSFYIGAAQGNADSLIEGLTVYRRPLFDGTYGIDVGNGDEIAQIFNNGVGQDPTLITGSWDVVFALPTNSSTGSLGVGGTGNAWSHPHASNLLYTSTTNTGGFMMGAGYSIDGWTAISVGDSTPTVSALDTTEKIYAGGYKYTVGIGATNQGIGRTFSATNGGDYVLRALGHSDGTCAPQVKIVRADGTTEISHLNGTVGSGRTAPDVYIFTWESPAAEAEQVQLLNTATSGTCYWHQVEVLANGVSNPSFESGEGNPFIPTGWGNNDLDTDDTEAEVDTKHSGSGSVRYNTGANDESFYFDNVVGGTTEGKFVAMGMWTFGDGSNGFMLRSGASSAQGVLQYSTSVYSLSSSNLAVWSHTKSVWRTGVSDLDFHIRTGGSPVGVQFSDDIYAFALTPVSLTVTPASLTNSTESTGIRIDGRDSGTAPMSNLSTTQGTIKFTYGSRHSAANSNKFVESGTVTDDAYIGEWRADGNNYVRLYWDSANTTALKYSMAGVGGSGTWNATNYISAGSTYPMVISYTGGSTMSLTVGTTTPLTLSSIPSSFNTAPMYAYWGSDSSSSFQGDATFAQVAVANGIKMQSDCDDVRFTDINGKALDYYYDATNGVCNAESTDFYVLMPTIHAGSNTIYMYYGNQSAPKGSKASNFSQSTFSQSSTATASEEQSSGPVAYWSLDEGYGGTVRDSSQARNDGVLGAGSSAPAWQTEDMCLSGKCLKYDGNDFVSIGSTARDVQTISFWVKPTTTSQNFIDLDNGTHYVSVSSGTVSATGFDSPTIYVNAKQNGTLTANNWNHIEVTTATSFNATNIKLGQRTSNFLTGFIDEIKIFNYARSSSQIKTDYNSRGASSEKGSAVIASKAKQSQDAFSQGLVGYWKMDEASWNGTVNEVIDSSGNGNHGIAVGATAPPTTGAGKFGNGGGFDGSEDYIETDITAITNYTISMWFKADTTSGARQLFYNTGDSIGIEILNNNIGVYDGNWNTTPFTSTAWTHIVAIGESGGNKKLYINGILKINVGYNRGIATGKAIFGISGNIRPFDGSLDEVRIYNRALSPAEVRQLYNWAPGPVAYYNFNEGIGSTAYDSSGNGNNGSLGTGNSAPTWTTGKYGRGLRFDGVNDYVNVVNSASLNFGTGDFTITGFLKKSTSTNIMVIVTTRYVCAHGNWIDFGAGDALKGEIDGPSDNYNLFVGNKLVSNGIWHHFTIIRSGVTIKIYVDGVLDKKVTGPGIADINHSNDLRIGGYFISSCNNEFFNGSIDELKFYNYARTQKQIIEDMNGGHPAGGSPVGSQVAKYSFDEGYGTTLNNDISGGISLTLGTGASAPSWSNDGKYGKALSFDGSGDYAYSANTALMAGNGQTYPSLAFSAWVYPSSSIASKTIIHKNTEFRVTTDADGKPNCSVYANGSWQTAAVSSSALSLNTWSHVLCDYDGSKIYTFINGANVGNVSETDQLTSSSSTGLYVGRDSTTATGTFQGLIDEIKIYNYSLTEDEINIDFNRGKSLVLGSLSSGTGNTAASNAASQEYCIPGDSTSCSPPVARWDFNEGIGSSAYDTSGNGNNGSLGAGSSAPTWDKGKVGKGLRFDGSNDYITLHSTALSVATGEFSFSLWFKPLEAQSNYLLRLGDAPSNNDFFLKIIYPDWVRFGMLNGSTWKDADATTELANSGWYFISGTFSTSTGQKLYINGNLEGTNSNTTRGTTPYATHFYLASYDGTNTFANGLIDQVRIYNYARTPAQIAWDYNKGKPVAWYKFNECQGVTTNNSVSTAAYNGAISIGSSGTQSQLGTCAVGTGSTAAWGNGSTGKYGGSLNFDGTDDYVSVGTGSSANSVSFWAKPTSNTASMVQLATGIGVTASSGVITAPGFTSPTIYVNGIPGSTLTADTWQMITVTSATAVNASAIKFGLVGSTYYSGQMDEIKIWNYPLTSVQVKTEYNQGSGVRFE